MAFRGLNVQFKVDLYMVCHRSQLHYDKVLVNEFCVFLISRGTVTDFFFRAFKSIFQEKKSHHVSRLTKEYERF